MNYVDTPQKIITILSQFNHDVGEVDIFYSLWKLYPPEKSLQSYHNLIMTSARSIFFTHFESSINNQDRWEHEEEEEDEGANVGSFRS